MKDIDNIFNSIQNAIDTQKELLKIAEESIKPDKSFTYSISFVFDNYEKYKFKIIVFNNRSLMVKNEQGNREPLELIEPYVEKILFICTQLLIN